MIETGVCADSDYGDLDELENVIKASHGGPCAHCEINRALDAWAARYHALTGYPTYTPRTIGDLMACAAELIAMYDTSGRKRLVKQSQELLAALTRERRKTGRYPGGPGAGLIQHPGFLTPEVEEKIKQIARAPAVAWTAKKFIAPVLMAFGTATAIAILAWLSR